MAKYAIYCFPSHVVKKMMLFLLFFRKFGVGLIKKRNLYTERRPKSLFGD